MVPDSIVGPFFATEWRPWLLLNFTYSPPNSARGGRSPITEHTVDGLCPASGRVTNGNYETLQIDLDVNSGITVG